MFFLKKIVFLGQIISFNAKKIVYLQFIKNVTLIVNYNYTIS